MGTGWSSRRVRAVVACALGATLLVALAVAAASTPDAATTGVNRPDLQRNPISGGCWPLPTEPLGFGHQLRGRTETSDADGERRRVLAIQYFLVDADDVEQRLDTLLTDAGFAPDPATVPGTYARPDYGTVRVEVEPLEDLADDAVVRGVLRLDLPADAAAAETRACRRARAEA